jgi:tyrosine-specific transport protein
LPVVTAAGGFWKSSLLLVLIWLLMTFSALLILEVNLWFPEESNLISMTRKTLGRTGMLVCWASCVLLLYCLLSAYISGGTDLVHELLLTFHLVTPNWLDTLVFVFIFALIVFHGVRIIDHCNRGLMTIKLLSFVLLIFFAAPLVNPHFLPTGSTNALMSGLFVIFTSFGYAVVIPSLRTYLKSDLKKLRYAVIIGGFVPLICYIAWDYTVQGSIPQAQLVHLNDSSRVITQLAQGLASNHHFMSMSGLAHLFTSICVLTALLGVALSLFDFLADGFKLKKRGIQRWWLSGLTFIPPTLIILVNPKMFIEGLRYAGIFCIIIFLILPACMAWRGRYHQKIAHGYQVIGGKPLLIALLAFAGLLFVLSFV